MSWGRSEVSTGILVMGLKPAGATVAGGCREEAMVGGSLKYLLWVLGFVLVGGCGYRGAFGAVA